ncbi:MAG: DUF4838 domain-containing protein [Lentisphaeria bacterium]|nr:DUF4838 domain-containing protein [Lentisphaeria bacterium]
MKRIVPLLVLSFCFAAFTLPAGAPFPTEKRSFRSIRIGKSPAFTLTAKNCTVVIAPDAPKTTRFAAAELQKFLSLILGGKIPVADKPGTGHNIYVGFGPGAAKMGLDPARTQIPRDGFFIRTAGKDILIAGCDDPKVDPARALRGGVWDQHYERATLFGVYDFLERFGNCRFYFPGELGTIVPRKESITVPECAILDRPDFLYRKYSLYWDGTYFEGPDRNRKLHPQKTLNFYRLRMETAYLPSNHGMTRFNLLERFAKTHPEYFALTNTGERRTGTTGMFAGHICWSSPVTEVIYQDMKAYLTGRPPEERGMYYRGRPRWVETAFRKPFVDVMPQDGFFACRCRECQARFGKGPDYANDVVWGTVIGWANRLKQEKIPGIITMMAYLPYRAVPKTPVPDNVVVMVADTGPWNDGGKPGARGDVCEPGREYGIAAWHKALGRKVWTWNYTYKTHANALPGVPAPSPLAAGRYYKEVAPHLFGAYLASNCDRFLYYAMNYYVLSRIAWDNAADYRAIMDEHYKLMYGPAAPVMQKLMEEFENLWIRRVIGRTVTTPTGPVNSTPGEHELWTVIFSPAKRQELNKRFDQAAAMVKKGSLEERRIRLYQREFMGVMEEEAARYAGRSKAVNLLKFAEGTPVYLRPWHTSPAAPETVKTCVTAKRENGMLKVVFDCEEPKMEKVVAFVRPRDASGMWRDNEVEFFINPSGDRKNYYQWVVNSKGSFWDCRWESIGQTKPRSDVKWNSNAQTRVSPIPGGFRIELLIPLKDLPPLTPKGVPVNFARSRTLREEPKAHIGYTWNPWAKSFHDLENYGRMIAPERELVPDGSFNFTHEVKTARGPVWKSGKSTFWARHSKPETYCALDKKIFFSAPQAMKIVSRDPGGNFFNLTLPPLKPGARYRLSAMVKLENVVPARKGGGFTLQFIDDRNHFFPNHNAAKGTAEWFGVSYEFSTTLEVGKAKRTSLRPWLLNCTGTAWVDNISLEELF